MTHRHPPLLAALLLAAATACGAADGNGPDAAEPVATTPTPTGPAPVGPAPAEPGPAVDDDRSVADLVDARRASNPPATWEALAAVDMFAIGGIGVAGQQSDGERLTRELAARPDAVAQLDRLATSASPAGQLYATWALTTLDPLRARPHLLRLRNDPAVVSTMSGCIRMDQTVAEAAGEITERGARRR